MTITFSIFYIGVDTSDLLDPKVGVEMCYTITIPEELVDIEDMVAMMSMDTGDKQSAMDAISEQYPEIDKFQNAMTAMSLRSRFQSDTQGPFKVNLPYDVNNEEGREIVEALVASKSKEELTSFLKQCKI